MLFLIVTLKKAKEVRLVRVENSSVLAYVILVIFLTRFFMAMTTVSLGFCVNVPF